MPDQVVLDRLGQDRLLVVPGGLVAVDVRQAHADQDGADVLVLELDRAFRSAAQERLQGPVVLGLAVRLPGKFGLQHAEVVGDDQIDLITGPGPTPLRGFLGRLGRHHGVLPLDREAEFPEHVVRLAGGLAAAELLGLRISPWRCRKASPMTALGG